MTEQELMAERRKQSFEAGDMKIDNPELKNLAYQIEISFIKLENSMLKTSDIESITKRIVEKHEKFCPLANTKFLTMENAYPEWKLCHAKHQQEVAQVTKAKISMFKDYRELFMFVLFFAYVIYQSVDFNKLFALLK